MKHLEKELEKSVGEIIIDLQREIEDLEEENKKLNKQIEQFKKGVKAGTKIIERLEIENKKLKETIKDHQLYEEKLEHRIIELEELLHGE